MANSDWFALSAKLDAARTRQRGLETELGIEAKAADARLGPWLPTVSEARWGSKKYEADSKIADDEHERWLATTYVVFIFPFLTLINVGNLLRCNAKFQT